MFQHAFFDVLLKMRSDERLMVRRSWSYFLQEARLLRYQRQIGFLAWHDYAFNLLWRGALRVFPGGLEKWLYKVARG